MTKSEQRAKAEKDKKKLAKRLKRLNRDDDVRAIVKNSRPVKKVKVVEEVPLPKHKKPEEVVASPEEVAAEEARIAKKREHKLENKEKAREARASAEKGIEKQN